MQWAFLKSIIGDILSTAQKHNVQVYEHSSLMPKQNKLEQKRAKSCGNRVRRIRSYFLKLSDKIRQATAVEIKEYYKQQIIHYVMVLLECHNLLQHKYSCDE